MSQSDWEAAADRQRRRSARSCETRELLEGGCGRWEQEPWSPVVPSANCSAKCKIGARGPRQKHSTPRVRAQAGDTMPAIKKERPDREELALAAFNQPMDSIPSYLAAAIPVVTPHQPAYEHLFAPRAYLGLHEPHHPPLPDDLMLERFSSIPDFQPLFDQGEPCIEVECGENKALLYIQKLCQGSKGPSIRYRGEWLTPNEFQFVSGRETAKDWKRSIRHKGKSLKTLMSKGILQVHPPICDCPGCRISSPVNRGRLAEKRTIPLPPSRIPKKEPCSVFSPGDDSPKGNGEHPSVKLEEDLHISIMKRSRENELSSIISNIHQSHQLVMPENQSKRNSHQHSFSSSDDFLGKKRECSPNSNSECPLESKKARSESPKENSQTPLLEEPLAQMTPEEHYRRMMSALNDHGSFEEQQQRLYQLANTMAVPTHSDLLRARQEVAAAVVRNPGAMEAHIPSSSNSSSQRRKQGLPQHRDTSHFTDREISHPPPLLSPQNAPHIALGPHLRPPFLGVPSALCQNPGYSFLQPAQAEMFARQQEMLRKQNLARLEMSAEIIRQKEFENLHRQRLLAGDPLTLHQSLPPDHPALRNIHELPEGHLLREELSRRNAMLVLRHNNTPLLSLNHQGVPSVPPPKESASSRRVNRKSAHHRTEPQGTHGESKELSDQRMREGVSECNDEEMKDSESEAEEKIDTLRSERGTSSSSHELQEGKDPLKGGDSTKESSDTHTHQSLPCGPSESPTHLLGSGISKSDGKYMPTSTVPPPQPLPFGFPYAVNPYFHTGAMGGLFLDGEESVVLEDLSKWTVEDVCSFVGSLSGCAEYPQVFREHSIDGETLPLLTEEHLLNNMGLKLGPALKIRAQVAKRIGRVLYMASFPVAFPLQHPALRPSERDLGNSEIRPASTGSAGSPFTSSLLAPSRISPKHENGSAAYLTEPAKSLS
ncbi:sterile alpha motif domain-containing protein 11 isoform X3 [Bombina bombina]|uniref:sterile alpha motif domain-containing protein 11 isoform X3 n=1 Tax=Bombina bombina TaxID=8345 RepID=UPI00235A5AEA|nr:sterile alpha motif domain-containing protein 11 isoform X3 [Bombina bombina]